MAQLISSNGLSCMSFARRDIRALSFVFRLRSYVTTSPVPLPDATLMFPFEQTDYLFTQTHI